MDLEIKLCALDQDMTVAWSRAFCEESAVTVVHGDILDLQADAILSPANSFGFMDGGIDLLYSEFFGWDLERRLQAEIAERYFGELPVGCAVIVETGHSEIPFLISAPTMRIPSEIPETVNAYLAFRAALLEVRRRNASSGRPIRSLLAPALGAGVGGVPFPRVARQMHAAYVEVVLGRDEWRHTATGILDHHEYLVS